jgi:hypothetical protein
MLLALAASFGLIKLMLPETIQMSAFNAGEFSVITTSSLNVFLRCV